MEEDKLYSSLENNTTQAPNNAPLPSFPEAPQAPKQDNKFISAIPKKTCAIEVLSYVKKIKTVSILSIVGIFTALLAGYFQNRLIGVVFAVVFIIPIALMLANSVKEEKRLSKEYGLK